MTTPMYSKCPKILNTKVSGKMPYANSGDLDQTVPHKKQNLSQTNMKKKSIHILGYLL